MVSEELKALRKKYVGKSIDVNILLSELETWDPDVYRKNSDNIEITIHDYLETHTYQLDLIDGKVIAKIYPDHAEYEVSTDATHCKLVRCDPDYSYLETALEESLIEDSQTNSEPIAANIDDEQDEDDIPEFKPNENDPGLLHLREKYIGKKVVEGTPSYIDEMDWPRLFMRQSIEIALSKDNIITDIHPAYACYMTDGDDIETDPDYDSIDEKLNDYLVSDEEQ